MAKRDSFLLRVDPHILEAIRRWSEDELRSMNSQIEYILRSKLKDAGRFPQSSHNEASHAESQAISGSDPNAGLGGSLPNPPSDD